MQNFLESNSFFNQQHREIEHWVNNIKGDSAQDKAVSIYYLVRDGIWYDPFEFLKGVVSLSSDFCLDNKVGYCISKAALQITLSRAVGIPSRLGLADVRNHLSTPALDKLLKTDVFTMHAYVEQFINGQWVKSTPAFNKELCEKANIKTLEFDGINHSIFQPYTPQGEKHMEYLIDHGAFGEMPVGFIHKNCKLHYPHLTSTFSSLVREEK